MVKGITMFINIMRRNTVHPMRIFVRILIMMVPVRFPLATLVLMFFSVIIIDMSTFFYMIFGTINMLMMCLCMMLAMKGSLSLEGVFFWSQHAGVLVVDHILSFLFV